MKKTLFLLFFISFFCFAADLGSLNCEMQKVAFVNGKRRAEPKEHKTVKVPVGVNKITQPGYSKTCHPYIFYDNSYVVHLSSINQNNCKYTTAIGSLDVVFYNFTCEY